RERGRAAPLAPPGGAVADLEEGNEAGGLAAARERLVLAAQRGEVGPGARAVLEDAGLARPKVHDPAVVDQIVGHGLDETRVRLRALVGAGGASERSRVWIDVVVALGRAGEAVGVVEAGVEPLRRVGGRD